MENAADCNGKRRLAVLSVGNSVARYHDAKESVYPTKSREVLLMMDAVEFDNRPDAFEGLREYEERIGRAISRGYNDVMNGRVRPLAQAVQDVERMRYVRCED